MELHVYLAFVIATVIMIAMPGPSVLLTVSHSISFGWLYALFTVAGATAGIGVQLLVAAAGLSSLLNTVTSALVWIKLAGAAYLVYVGIRQLASDGGSLSLGSAAVSKRSLFVQGLIVTIPNPKSLIFIAAFLPQFIDGARPHGQQFLIIVPTFMLITFVVTAMWAAIAEKAAGLFREARWAGGLSRAAGTLMVMAGLGLAMVRRGS